MEKQLELRNKLVEKLMSIPYTTKKKYDIERMQKLINRIEKINKKIIALV